MAKERWKRIKEERNYLISSWGRVFSLISKRVMKPNIHKSRSNYYMRIELGGNKYFVHWLVALNFKRKEYEALKLSKPDEKIQVGHDDRNTLNNNLNNLNFETESENKIHMHQTSVIKFGGKTYKGKME